MNRLAGRLFLAFAAVTLLAGALTALLATRVTSSEIRHVMTVGPGGGMHMTDAASLRGQLEASFAATGGWAEAAQVLEASAPHMRMMGGWMVLAAPDGAILAGAEGGRLSKAQAEAALPLVVEDRIVGLLSAEAVGPGMDPGAGIDAVLARVNRALLLSTLVAMLLALGLSLLFVRGLGRPLAALAAAAERVAGGDLATRVPVTGPTEIRVVASAFNQMTEGLARQESLRQAMLDDIAHELRTPLTVIRAQVEAIVDGIFPATPEHLTPLGVQVQQVSLLVEDLRTLAQAEAGHLSLSRGAVALRPLVDELLGTLVGAAVAPGIQAHNALPEDLPDLDADALRLRQVLVNLLSNALRHTPPGGSITVDARPEGPALRIRVRDSGSGIAAEDLPRVFDRFYRAEPSRNRATGGSGLGLAIARQLVEAHGGTIGIESRLGEGTTVSLVWPVLTAR